MLWKKCAWIIRVPPVVDLPDRTWHDVFSACYEIIYRTKFTEEDREGVTMSQLDQRIKSIAVIGNHVPRKCGIATFTTHLCDALEQEIPDSANVIVVALNDVKEGYGYPDRVKFEIRDKVQTDYLRAAEFLNVSKVDVAILQHEYGIFGGQCGAHVFHLIKNLRMPVLTTLHTVPSNPQGDQKAVLFELGEISEKIIVMSRKAREMLTDIYHVAETKIAVVPHGIPDVPFLDPCFFKDQFGLEDRQVILTFGLLGPGKGIETMIESMPAIVRRHPNVVYVILGATHPHVLKAAGEEYRYSLQQKVQRLNLEKHVLFFNQFLDIQSLIRFLTTADVYVCPYPSKDQVVSGTLSYAMGVGKAVVSTPFWHAEEALADGRGILVPFEDPDAMAKGIIELLSSDSLRNSVRKKAYHYSRPMVWKEVARSYLHLVREVTENQGWKPRPEPTEIKTQKVDTLPRINLNHIRIMTDDTGILQHSYFSMPRREDGYCLDDNARALIAMSMYHNLHREDNFTALSKTYFSFIINAFNREKGRFRNFMSYDRKWLEEVGSEDAHGRALWALGVTISKTTGKSVRDMVCSLFIDSIRSVDNFRHLRAWAFTLIGIHHYLKVYEGDAEVKKTRRHLAKRLYDRFKENGSADWPWPEDILTYANARLPHALILAGKGMGNIDMLQTGLTSLRWILQQQTDEKGHISIIGNKGWMRRNGARARFDQQPLEIMALIEGCADAFRITRDNVWLKEARRCFDWFMGKNDLNIPVYDFASGGCHDALEPHGVNENMGAESSLAWLVSLLTMNELFGIEHLLKTKDNIKTMGLQPRIRKD